MSVTMCALLLYVISVVLILKILNRLLGFWCRSKVCLVGKTAVVTGGASGLQSYLFSLNSLFLYGNFSGIGSEVALGLASKGCRVIIADITNLTEAVERLKQLTNNPLIIGNINTTSNNEKMLSILFRS